MSKTIYEVGGATSTAPESPFDLVQAQPVEGRPAVGAGARIGDPGQVVQKPAHPGLGERVVDLDRGLAGGGS